MALTDLVPWKWGEKNVPVKREEADPSGQAQELCKNSCRRIDSAK